MRWKRPCGEWPARLREASVTESDVGPALVELGDALQGAGPGQSAAVGRPGDGSDRPGGARHHPWRSRGRIGLHRSRRHARCGPGGRATPAGRGGRLSRRRGRAHAARGGGRHRAGRRGEPDRATALPCGWARGCSGACSTAWASPSTGRAPRGLDREWAVDRPRARPAHAPPHEPSRWRSGCAPSRPAHRGRGAARRACSPARAWASRRCSARSRARPRPTST